jgi:hypothetical protein
VERGRAQLLPSTVTQDSEVRIEREGSVSRKVLLKSKVKVYEERGERGEYVDELREVDLEREVVEM